MFDTYKHENELADPLDVLDLVTGDIDSLDDGSDIDENCDEYDEELDDEYLYTDASELDDSVDPIDIDSDDIIADIVNDVDGDLIDIVYYSDNN